MITVIKCLPSAKHWSFVVMGKEKNFPSFKKQQQRLEMTHPMSYASKTEQSWE